MRKLFTLEDMADLFANLDPTVSREILHRRVRNLKAKGFIRPTETRDGRNTGEFDVVELYRARLYLVAYTAMFDARRIDALERELANAASTHNLGVFVAPSQKIDGGSVSYGGLIDAIRGTVRGEPWRLTIRGQIPHITGVKAELVFIHHADDDVSSALPIGAAEPLYAFTIDLNSAFNGLPKFLGEPA